MVHKLIGFHENTGQPRRRDVVVEAEGATSEKSCRLVQVVGMNLAASSHCNQEDGRARDGLPGFLSKFLIGQKHGYIQKEDASEESFLLLSNFSIVPEDA